MICCGIVGLLYTVIQLYCKMLSISLTVCISSQKVVSNLSHMSLFHGITCSGAPSIQDAPKQRQTEHLLLSHLPWLQPLKSGHLTHQLIMYLKDVLISKVPNQYAFRVNFLRISWYYYVQTHMQLHTFVRQNWLPCVHCTTTYTDHCNLYRCLSEWAETTNPHHTCT